MGRLDEAVAGLAADALGGGVWRDEFGMGRFERAQAIVESIVIGVGELGRVEHIVEMLVAAQLLAQGFDLLAGSGFRRHSGMIIESAGSPAFAKSRPHSVRPPAYRILRRMEPMTHLMTGACLARAGFNRKAAYATLAMTLAAEAPDLDVLWSADGPVAAFQHHRGITHTLVGLPFDGLVVLGAAWLFHRWRVRRRRPRRTRSAWARARPAQAGIRRLRGR